jgi:hypothetical protein
MIKTAAAVKKIFVFLIIRESSPVILLGSALKLLSLADLACQEGLPCVNVNS